MGDAVTTCPDLDAAENVQGAAEVSAVNSVDDRLLPCPGPMTKAIAEVYGRAVRGKEDKYKDWCEHVG